MLSADQRAQRKEEREARRRERRAAWENDQANAKIVYMRRQAERDAAARARAADGMQRPGYAVLLEIANDPLQDAGARVRAAAEAAQYERPKLTASINQTTTITSIGDELDRARQRVTLPKLIDRR